MAKFLLSIACLLSILAHQASSLPLGTVNAKPLEKRGGRTFTLPIKVNYSNKKGNESAIEARDEPIGLQNEKWWYSTEIYLGSNNQKITVDVDTGSSDLWVPGKGVQCASGIPCTEEGTFDPSSSTTNKHLDRKFEASYLDGTHSEGDYVTDSLSFNSDGSDGVTNFQFGVATESANRNPILGIGFKALEATEDGNYKYDNLPIVLKKQGKIDKVSYAIFLNDQKSDTGNVLFGGYDKAKIDGDFVTLPVTALDRLNIDLNSVSFNGQVITTSKLSATADTGYTYTTLAPDQFNAIGQALGGTYINNFYTVQCSKFEGKELDFNFNGITIKVPFTDLLDNLGNDVCDLLIRQDDRISSLGDNFLRHAYLYYDLEARTISLGQAKYTDQTDIVTQ